MGVLAEVTREEEGRVGRKVAAKPEVEVTMATVVMEAERPEEVETEAAWSAVVVKAAVGERLVAEMAVVEPMGSVEGRRAAAATWVGRMEDTKSDTERCCLCIVVGCSQRSTRIG